MGTLTSTSASQLEQEAPAWLQDVGYTHLYGLEIAFDDPKPQRAHCGQAPLTLRLREAIHKLNRPFPRPFQCQKWL